MIHLDVLSPPECQCERINCIGSDKCRQFFPLARATMESKSSGPTSEFISKSSKTKMQMLIKIRKKNSSRTLMIAANTKTRTINLEKSKRKTTKIYHPIIRLLSSLQVLAILTLVPIKPIYAQFVEPNNNQIGDPQFQRTDMLNNFAFLNNQNQDWAKRMLKASNDLQHQQHHILPRFNPSPANLVAELRDGQSFFRPNMRQTLLADFVANQGQRILKNLVNNTISDIVSQSAIKLATKSLIPQGQQFLLQQLQQQQQQQQPLVNYQMLPNENLNNRYFPTVGKLYTLLFPNNQLVPQQSPLKTQSPSPSSPNQTLDNSPTVEAIQSSSSNHQNLYLGKAQKQPPVLQGNKDYSSKESFQEKQVVSLIAPYDSRPRKSVTRSNFLPSSSEPSALQTSSSQFDGKRSRRDKSRPSEQRGSKQQRPSTIPYDQAQESAGDEVVSGENGAIPAGLDPESLSQFETSDLLQSNQRVPEEQEADDRNKQEVNSANNNQLDNSTEQSESEQVGDRTNEIQQLTSNSDFSGYFGARKNHPDNHQDQNGGRNLAIEAQMDQLNQGSLQNQEPIEHHSNHKNQTGGADYLIGTGNHSPNQSTQDDDGNFNQAEMNLIDQQQRHQVELLENATSDKRDAKVGQADTNVDTFTNLNRGTERFKTSLTNDTQNDESFLTAKLPSQYDAVIRMPPEGYYDDYFKPVSSNIALQSSTQTTASLLNQDGNGISEYPIVSQSPAEPIREHTEHFEIEPASLTSGQSMNSSQTPQQNRNYQDSNQANFIPLSMDYAKQFYSNQQSIKPNEANVEHSIEILPQTNQTTSSNKKHETINYELPTVYDQYQNDSHISNHPSEITTSGRNISHKYIQSLDNESHEMRDSPSSPHYSDQNEDSIQVIIANTNNSRDPVSNEKVINYTSDGQNITRLAGKPARNTFVNKDMNEFPPADEQIYQRDRTSIVPERNIMQQQMNGLDQQQLDHIEDKSFNQQVQPPNFTLKHSQTQSQLHLPIQYNVRAKSQPQQSSSTGDDDRDVESRPQINGNDDDANEMRRLTSKVNGLKTYNSDSDDAAQNVDESSDTATMSSKMDSRDNFIREQRSFERNNNMNSAVRDRRQKSEREHYDDSRRRPRGQKYSLNQPKMSKNNQNHRANRLHKQQTVRRPQVTQAHFDPKDLITNAPTPSPSVTESTVESISELPAKVKRLKDNQPDKNELMNELLTALDRVKVAIYKLQPLTAKMNAIYRKSVTSNTRDIIMDNHKGTYAKRYPPGDYDDTYDRMHPSELISRDRSSNSRKRRTNSGIEANESTSSAVYLPAPKEILESYERNYTTSTQEPPVSKSIIEIENLGESQIVATGIGRRLGDGRVRGELDLNPGNRGNFNDFSEDENSFRENATSRVTSAQQWNASSNTAEPTAPFFMPVKPLLEDSQSPLFGYRITIFQSPDGGGAEDGDADRNRERFSYSTEGLLNSLERSSDDDSDSDTELGSDSNKSAGQESRSTTTKPLVSKEDSMVTSESSIVEQQLTTSPSSVEEPEEGESKKKEEKKSSHESEKEKKSHKEEGKKKKEGSKKSSSKKKKQEEEKKKKKEYKKIKHDKKVVSKEKKSMKRDKHIKAHDRGAAKEKALKERTQIEFFEREQIVDDEFEKGKKSTTKAGWETGHDSKKTMKDSSSGDPMSVGGSQHIAQHIKDKHVEKGSGIKLAASSAKKSNKFEKKNMDAKGKKFKGWREKGYKIITETEFIDRGSLHDSAYKKRDKGAAHHQKYKKHQASSEGHHGSMHVHHKKSAKEEKKKSKMHEKKAMNSKKSEKEGNKHEKKSGKKKKEKSDDKHSAASSEDPVEVKNRGEGEDEETLEGKESVGNSKKQPGLAQPILLAVGSSSFVIPKNSYSSSSDSALSRLLYANHHEEPIALNKGDDYSMSSNPSSSPNVAHSTSSLTLSNKSLEATSSAKLGLVEFPGDEASRRSDVPTTRAISVQRQSPQNFQNISSPLDRSNATILDIVDNITGRKINKANLAYEVASPGLSNNSLPLVAARQVTSVKHFPAPSAPQINLQPRNSSGFSTDGNNDDDNSAIYTTNRPLANKPSQLIRRQPSDAIDETNLLGVLQKAQKQRQMSNENQNEVALASLTTRNPGRGPTSISTSWSSQINQHQNPPTPYLTPEQAKLAANLLQFVQRANGANRANSGPMAASNQHQSLIEASLAQNRNQFSQSTSFISPPTSDAHRTAPTAIFNIPTNVNHYSDSTGLRTLGNDQFLDYEQDPLSRSQQAFLFG